MSKVFSLSEAATIGLHTMVLVARSKEMLSSNQIADMIGSSRHHVAKVLQRLVKDDLLSSNRGPYGGFVLKRPPEDICLKEIYESIEGKIEITKCPMDKPVCPFNKCIISNVINKLTKEFSDYLGSQTLKDYL